MDPQQVRDKIREIVDRYSPPPREERSIREERGIREERSIREELRDLAFELRAHEFSYERIGTILRVSAVEAKRLVRECLVLHIGRNPCGCPICRGEWRAWHKIERAEGPGAALRLREEHRVRSRARQACTCDICYAVHLAVRLANERSRAAFMVAHPEVSEILRIQSEEEPGDQVPPPD
jgi:hypothetical protein